MRILFLLITLSFSCTANSAVYKTVLPDGSIIYSDQPPRPESEEIPLSPLQEMRPVAPAPDKMNAQANKSDDMVESYIMLSISSPENDATVRDNTGNVQVQLQLEPELKTKLGHTITITLDGAPLATGLTTVSATLENVERGTHILGALVVGRDGSSLISATPITFHLQRFSALQRRTR